MLDAAYCYRRVAWPVCVSIGRIGEPCKTTELIEMPFGGQMNRMLDGVQIPNGGGNFWGCLVH